jgi:hypothetical protein
MGKTVIHFERVGRDHEIPDVELPGKPHIGRIVQAIERVAARRLRSSSWEIGISEDLTDWDIEFGRFGKGSVEFVEGD